MSITLDGVEYLPLSAAAERLATTEMKILMLLKKKELTGDLIDGSWLVTASSIANYKPESGKETAALSCHASCRSSGCGCH